MFSIKLIDSMIKKSYLFTQYIGIYKYIMHDYYINEKVVDKSNQN